MESESCRRKRVRALEHRSWTDPGDALSTDATSLKLLDRAGLEIQVSHFPVSVPVFGKTMGLLYCRD
jgi:hypothetical protein